MTRLFQAPRCPYEAVDADYCDCGATLTTNTERLLLTCEDCAKTTYQAEGKPNEPQ